MKKRARSKKDIAAPHQADQDVASVLGRMQQQLTFLEKKIDTLIANSASKPAEQRHFQKPFQQHGYGQGGGQGGQGRSDNNYRDRVLHKAICADCKKECEVPFKPSGERPVYCKECFSKRKAGESFKERPGSSPREESHAQDRHFGRRQRPEKDGYVAKKKMSFRRRKTK